MVQFFWRAGDALLLTLGPSEALDPKLNLLQAGRTGRDGRLILLYLLGSLALRFAKEPIYMRNSPPSTLSPGDVYPAVFVFFMETGLVSAAYLDSVLYN